MSVALLAASAILCVLALLVARYYAIGFSLSRRSGIPWVSILPFLGKTHPHDVISRLAKDHGPIFMHYVGVTNVFLCDAAIIRAVLKEDLVPKAPPGTTPCIAKFMDQHIIGANGPEYKKHKAIIEPFFKADSFRGYSEKYIEKALVLLDRLAQADGAEVDAAVTMTQLALDVLGATLLGVDFNSLSGGTNATVFSLGVFVRELANPIRMMYPNFENLTMFQTNRELQGAVSHLSAMMTGLIEKKNKERGTKNPEDLDLFDLLLEATEHPDPQKRLRDSEVIGNTMVMIIAGHESTAAALTWALFFLAKYPEIQERVHDEVQRVLGGNHPTVDSIKDLHYLTRVIKESMRLMAPVGEVPGRQCSDDTPIPGTDYILPKDAYVTFSIWSVHRDPKNWPDPERFDPDRFLPENSKGRDPYAFMPFSAGKRPCAGQQFSLIEQHFVISLIIQKFQVLFVDKPIKLKTGIMSAPENAWVRFIPRDKLSSKVVA